LSTPQVFKLFECEHELNPLGYWRIPLCSNSPSAARSTRRHLSALVEPLMSRAGLSQVPPYTLHAEGDTDCPDLCGCSANSWARFWSISNQPLCIVCTN
jgi:hypothetical protein